MTRDVCDVQPQKKERASSSEPWPLRIDPLLLTEIEHEEGTTYEILPQKKVCEIENEIKSTSEQISSLKAELDVKLEEKDQLCQDIGNTRLIECQRRCDDLDFNRSTLEKKCFALQHEMLKHIIAHFKFLYHFAKEQPSYVKLLSSEKAKEQQMKIESLSRSLVPLNSKLDMKLTDQDVFRKRIESGQRGLDEELFECERECHTITLEQQNMQERLMTAQHDILGHRVFLLTKSLRNNILTPTCQPVNRCPENAPTQSHSRRHTAHVNDPNIKQLKPKQSKSSEENALLPSRTENDEQTQSQVEVLLGWLQTLNTSVRDIVVQFDAESGQHLGESYLSVSSLDDGPARLLQNVKYLKSALMSLRAEQRRTVEGIENIVDCLGQRPGTHESISKLGLHSRLRYLQERIQTYAAHKKDVSAGRCDATQKIVRRFMQKEQSVNTPTIDEHEIMSRDKNDATISEDAGQDTSVSNEDSGQDTSSGEDEPNNDAVTDDEVMYDAESALDDDIKTAEMLERRQMLDRELDDLEAKRRALIQDNFETTQILLEKEKEENKDRKDIEELQQKCQNSQKILPEELLSGIIAIKTQCEQLRSDLDDASGCRTEYIRDSTNTKNGEKVQHVMESVERLRNTIRNLLDVIR